MDQDTACTAVGVLAIGAILCHYRERAAHPPSECRAGAVSARVATPVAPMDDENENQGDELWGLSKEADEHMQTTAAPTMPQSTRGVASAMKASAMTATMGSDAPLRGKKTGVKGLRAGEAYNPTQGPDPEKTKTVSPFMNTDQF